MLEIQDITVLSSIRRLYGKVLLKTNIETKFIELRNRVSFEQAIYVVITFLALNK